MDERWPGIFGDPAVETAGQGFEAVEQGRGEPAGAMGLVGHVEQPALGKKRASRDAANQFFKS